MRYPLLKQSTLSLACFSGLIAGQAGVANPPSTAIVQQLTPGDRACYVEIMDDQGQLSTQYADFEICEQDLVGKRVTLTYEAVKIQAASCEGDPECTASETVMLITEANPID